MVRLSLEICCNLENVKEFIPEDNDFRWYIKIKCSQCGESDSSGKWQYISLSEVIDCRRSKAHMVSKCKFCLRELSIVIEENSIKPYKYVEEKEQDFQSIAIFECRGCEIIDFEARGGWIVTSLEKSHKFANVDLTEKDWADYDDNAGGTVGIYELQHKISRA